MAQAPIFIVGPPRTGTTLTARILSGHPAIHISPVELVFFQRLYVRRKEIGQPDGSAAFTTGFLQALKKIAYKKRRERDYWAFLDRVFEDADFLEGVKGARSYGELLDRFMGAQAAHFGKDRWGNQVPSDLFALDHIFGFYPDAKVVVCVRHPLDFLVSNRDREVRALRRNKPAKAKRSRATYHPVLTSLQWRLCVRHARKHLEARPTQVRLNRYEDLVKDPDAQVSALCDFLGVAFDPAMLEVSRNNSSREVTSGGIFTSSVGQWRESLSPEVAHTCQSLCRSGMAALGYERHAVDAGPLALARQLMATPAALGRLLRAQGELDDDLTPYMLKRLVS